MSADEDDYSADVEVTLTDDRVATIVALAQQQIEVEREVSDLTELLANAQRRLAAISEVSLPEALTAAGMTHYGLTNGLTVSIDDKVFGGIKEENVPVAHRWLRDNEHGDLIKQTVTATFGRGQDKLAADLVKVIRDLPFANQIGVDRKEGVHYQTLGAFVREQVKLGTELPPEIEVVTKRKTVITRPQTRKSKDAF